MPADPPPQPVQPIGPQPQPPQGPVPTPEPIQRPSAGRFATACTALVLIAGCSTDPRASSPSREDDCRGPANLCKQDSAR